MKRRRKDSIEEQNIFINSYLYFLVRLRIVGRGVGKLVEFSQKYENLCLVAIFGWGVLLDVEMKLASFCLFFLVLKPYFVMVRRYAAFAPN